jgi:hypothetical protein
VSGYFYKRLQAMLSNHLFDKIMLLCYDEDDDDDDVKPVWPNWELWAPPSGEQDVFTSATYGFT